MRYPQPRARIETAETLVLVRCLRRCCLCYGLRRDASEKKGQLAHIDRDRSRSSERDLAFLCHDHHSEYDSVSRQSKGISPKELRHHKTELELAVKQGNIVASAVVPEGLRWAALNIADESIWYDLQFSAGEDFVYFAWPAHEGSIPIGKFSDPIFDFTLLNSGSSISIVSSIGVIAKRSYTKLAGLPLPQRIHVSDFLRLDFKWARNKPQMVKLPHPISLRKNSPVRFKLHLAGFSKAVPGNFAVLQLACMSDRGLLKSEGICLAT